MTFGIARCTSLFTKQLASLFTYTCPQCQILQGTPSFVLKTADKYVQSIYSRTVLYVKC